MNTKLSTDFGPFLPDNKLAVQRAPIPLPSFTIPIAGRHMLNYGGFMQLSIPVITSTCLLAMILSGCAMADADFPSLARRDYEVTDTIEAESLAEDENAIERAGLEPDPALATQLTAIEAQARKSHAAYDAKRPAVRALAEGAKGAPISSEAWSVAQAAFSDLEASRRDIAVLLADLDSLYIARLLQEVDGSVAQGGADQIKATHDRIQRLFDAEASELDALQAMLATA